MPNRSAKSMFQSIVLEGRGASAAPLGITYIILDISSHIPAVRDEKTGCF